LGGINYSLNELVSKGSVKIQNFRNNKNKSVYAYLITPQGLAEKASLTGAFLKRKIQEYHQLKEEIESLSREVSEGQSSVVDAANHRLALRLDLEVGIGH
jgi:EPS-associated MarR family transcriptional regulator